MNNKSSEGNKQDNGHRQVHYYFETKIFKKLR